MDKKRNLKNKQKESSQIPTTILGLTFALENNDDNHFLNAWV